MIHPAYIYVFLALLILLLEALSQQRIVKVVAWIGVAAILFFAFCHAACAGPGDVVDRHGRVLTRSTRAGHVETVRDAGSGRIIETKTTVRGETTVRDPAGRVTRIEKK